MKLKNRILNIGFNIFMIAAIILFVYALFGGSTGENAYVGSFKSYMYSEGWAVTSSYESRESVILPAWVRSDKGGLVTLRNTLPANISSGMSMAFHSSMEDVDIYIDGALRASYRMDNTDMDIGYLPSSYIFVDLSPEDAAKEIEIRVFPYDGGMVFIDSPEYAYGNNVWFSHIKANLVVVLVAVALMALGLVAVAVFTFLHKKINMGSAFLYLSQFIIVISLWLLSESKIRQLFFESPYLSSAFAYMFVELIAAYAVAFVNELQARYYQKIFTALEIAIFAQLAINTVLNFTGLVYYHDTLLLSHVWSAAAIVIVFVTLILDIRSGRVKNYLIAAYGLGGIILCSIIEILSFYLTDKSLLGLPIGVGLLILIGTTLTQTVSDIMALKHEKDQIETAAYIATESNRAKSEFLAQMSHEIRTPINAVLGMNEMILRESNEENIQQYASNAYNAGNALLSIINDILDISKIEAGKLEIVEEDYELYSLINDCCNLTADRAEKKDLLFSCDVDEALPSKLSGDMFHIRQIVVNLLTNAIKYTDSGSVTLSVSGGESENGFMLSISVKDTGIGLDDESKEKLFTSFQRFDLKHNRAVEGTGLGLAISKQLADLMGGTINVDSVYGKGSTFTLTLLQRVADKTPVGKVAPLHSAKKLEPRYDNTFTAKDARLLVVDDVEMNLVVFKSLLKKHGFIIDTALSGMQCLELIKEQKYDVIFMDHMMPDMNGIETFRKMRESRHQNSDTPVIMLTANAISGEREKYLSEGFASYLTKPIQSDKLEKTLLQYLPPEKIIFEKAANEQAKEQVNEQANEQPEGPKANELQGTRFWELKAAMPDFDLKEAVNNCGGDEDFFVELLKDFNIPKKLSEMSDALAKDDLESYEVLIHTIKGSMRTFGFPELGNTAERLQKAAEHKDVELIASEHPKAEAMLAKIAECLKKL